MKTLYKTFLKARDLPQEWREEGSFAPDEEVTVYIEAADPELTCAGSLLEVMNIIGRRAQA